MGWKFNDLELGSTSAVTDALETAEGVTLTIICTAAERRALQEMMQNAGRYSIMTLALGQTMVVDPTGGLNTIFVTSGAATQADGGWYAVRSLSDSWDGRTTHARMRVDLVRIAGQDNATGTMVSTTQFLAHDF